MPLDLERLPPVDPTSPVPLYHQIKLVVLEAIGRGLLRPGERLPTEHELCELLGVSRTPTTRALGELADEGVLIRMRRRGTFVNPHWAPRADPHELRIVVSDPTTAERIRATPVPDVRLNVAVVEYGELHRTLTRAVGEGRAPDLALIDEVWIADFAHAGFLVPLDELDPDWIAREYRRDFVAAFVRDREYEGRIYAVPEEINLGGLWLRRDLLERVGGRPPESWSDLLRLARDLQATLPRGHDAFMAPGGYAAAETTTYTLATVLASNGAAVIDDGRVVLDSGAAVEALRLYRRLVEHGTMSPDVVAHDWLEAPRALGGGRAAMTLGGSYEAEVIADAAGIPLRALWRRFAFLPFPEGPRGQAGPVAGGMAYTVFRQSADPAAAMRVIEHLTTTPLLAARAHGRPLIPPRRSAMALAASESDFVAAMVQRFDRVTTRPAIPHYHMVSIQLQHMVEAVITGTLRPAAAAERTAEVISAITGLPVVHASTSQQAS